MFKLRQHRRLWLAASALGVAWVAAPAADPPADKPQPSMPSPAPIVDANVIPAQQPGVVPQSQPPTAGGGGGPTAAEALGLGQGQQQGLALPGAANLGAASGSRVANAEGGAGAPSSVPLGGSGSPVLNASDLGEILSKSPGATGVEVQRRNAIISDPRVRGYRVGEVVTLGDGALFFPARQDLDTAVAKFDPGSVRDILIFKGPYTSLYGPGFAFLDIVTLDSPRYQCGFEAHGRTSFGYQTNGNRWDGLQSIYMGDKDWGFRATYNLLAGNDYLAGDGTDVASSYNSNNVNFALGADLTENSKIEFKGLRVHQHQLEFPGLYFDINQLDTEAYSLRYTLERQPYFDRMILDTWYNTTVADGNTLQGKKQAFVQQLLFVSFNPLLNPAPPVAMAPPGASTFTDQSTTRFSDKSLGYRWAFGWGDIAKKEPTLTAGTDFNLIGQSLIENINITQIAGTPVPTSNVPLVVPQLLSQTQSIPRSSATDPGLFVETSLPINDRLKVKGGGRVDYVHTTSDPRRVSGNIDLFGAPQNVLPPPVDRFSFDPIIYSTDPTRTDLDRDFFLLAGFISSEYKITEHITALSATGYSERAPTLTELYAAGPFIGVLQQGTSRLFGDPNLEKPKLAQFDVGLSADYGWIRGGVTGFYAYVQDYITFDQNKSSPQGGITQVVFTNTDRATLAGGEMFGQFDLTCWLTPFGNLSYVQGIDRTHRDNRRPATLASSRRQNLVTNELATDTEPLPQIPPLEMRTGMRLHPSTKTPKWQFEVSARTVMGQNNVATSLGELPTPGFAVFDVRSYWQVRSNWLLTAGVENFGDKLYREHLDPISGNLLGVDPLFRSGTNFYFASQVTY